METETPNTSPTRPGRGRRWLLYGSLALNLLVVGLVVGAVALGGGRDGPGREVIDSPIPLLRALDPEARDALRDRLRDTRPVRRDRSDDALRSTRDLLTVLRAEVFDPAAFEDLVTRQAEAFAARNLAGRSALFAVVTEMSPEDRRAYADRIEEQLRKRRDRRPRTVPPGSGG